MTAKSNDEIIALAKQAGVYSDCTEWTIKESKTFVCTHTAIHNLATLCRADLVAENENLRTVMMAAAVEITEHWDAHCDDEGYGPANLLRRLENGYPAQYGYGAATVVQLEKERDALRAENERIKKQVIRAANFELDLLRALDGQETLCGFAEIAEVEKLKADNLDLRSDEALNEAEAEIARLKNNLGNATNILQSVLNGKTSPQLAQVVVNTLNEVLDAARGVKS